MQLATELRKKLMAQPIGAALRPRILMFSLIDNFNGDLVLGLQ